MKIEVEQSNLQKIWDVLDAAADFHHYRDKMNSRAHLSQTRWSPLTRRLNGERGRLNAILDRADPKDETAGWAIDERKLGLEDS